MDFNYSYPNATELGDISLKEIQYVYHGRFDETVWEPLPKYDRNGILYFYLIGFSNKFRFLQIVIACDGDTVYFTDVKVADNLNEIREDFFNKL